MIPDNTISTTEGQEETTTTENTQLPCPTNDSQLMDGRCVYFEKEPLTYDKATQNCQEKLKDYGGGILYEPHSIAEQKRIVDMLFEHFSYNWAWIGVTDKTAEGQFTYNSNNQPINFTPDWHSGGSSGERSYNCINMYVTSPNGSYYSEWYDISCTNTRPSICWSLPPAPTTTTTTTTTPPTTTIATTLPSSTN